MYGPLLFLFPKQTFFVTWFKTHNPKNNMKICPKNDDPSLDQCTFNAPGRSTLWIFWTFWTSRPPGLWILLAPQSSTKLTLNETATIQTKKNILERIHSFHHCVKNIAEYSQVITMKPPKILRPSTQVGFSLKFCLVALQKVLTLLLPYWNTMLIYKCLMFS